MGRFVQLHWPASPGAMGPRRARAAFAYQAFVPDPIVPLQLSLSAEALAAVSQAERATADLNRDPPVVGHLEILARRLLRSESVASSRIEGLQLSQRRLARAEAMGDESRDETAQKITERSKQAANEAMAALERAGVLKQVSVAKRNRVWEANEVFGVLDDFEREMATPLAGDPAGRRAPYPGRGRSRNQR